MKINRFLLNGLVEFDYTNSDQKALPENTDSRSVDPPHRVHGLPLPFTDHPKTK